MSNKRILDRALTPELMGIGLRIARQGGDVRKARGLLEIALRDEVESKTARTKTGTVLAGSWIQPAPEARSLVDWAVERANGDLRSWHLGVLLANYRFFDDLSAAVGRELGIHDQVVTRELRSTLKAKWGDREVVDVATRGGVRTLRAFGVVSGGEGDEASGRAEQIPVDREVFPWLIHALLVARGAQEMDLDELRQAPEWFMFDQPRGLANGYPHIERFNEGGGRTVVGQVVEHPPLLPATRQLAWDVPDEGE